MKFRAVGIQRQVLLMAIACSLITLLISGSIALYGMMDIKSRAVEVGKEIGATAADSSSNALRKTSTEMLQRLAHERAKQVDAFFDSLRLDVSVMAREMNTILRNPQDYASRSVAEPSSANAKKIVPQLQYGQGADRAALAREVGLAAHLQDFQMRFFEQDDTIGSNYVASMNGFTIITDDDSGLRVDQDNHPLPSDSTTRPWFQAVVRENKLIFTDVFSDAYGRGFAIGCAAPYYDADGNFVGVVGEGKFLRKMKELVNRTTVGETGFAFLLNNRTGQVLFSAKEEGVFAIDHDGDFSNDPSLFDNDDKDLAAIAHKMAAGETGVDLVTIDHVPSYVAYVPLKNANWSFGVIIEEAEVIAPALANQEVIENSTDSFVSGLNQFIKVVIFAMAGAFLVMLGIAPYAGKRVADGITQPILELSDGVRDIAGGNLDKKLDIRTGNEIEHLAVCFNAMTDELKRYVENITKITAEKERIATELSVATEIQRNMLPKDFPKRKDFGLYATMQAAKEVGGDFYDFYMLDDKHLVITIADVSGKGVPAALFMVISKTILKNFALTMGGADDVAPLVACTNDQLCQNNDAMMFVTAFVGMLDLTTGRFNFVNAGHNPPLVYRKAEDSFRYIPVERNSVLGGIDGLDFRGQEITLAPGDRLFLYTDGVTEALSEEAELYGKERLLDCLNHADAGRSTLNEVLASVRASLDAHVGKAEQSDDITMLALSYEGSEDAHT